MHHPTERIAHTAFVTPVVEHWLGREIVFAGRFRFHPTLILILFKRMSVFVALICTLYLKNNFFIENVYILFCFIK